jgi:hypothetical protein
MLSGQESRNQYNENLLTEETKAVLENMFGLTLPDLLHGDTLAHLWKQLDPQALEKMKIAMVKMLLRRRCLEAFRFRKQFYILAVDGTELYRWSEKHCDNCLHAVTGPNKSLQYYHRVLEIKLVSACGLSLSLLTEFIENASGKPDDKQDCELKAFYRLSRRLKETFPQLKILLLADGLYPIVLGVSQKRHFSGLLADLRKARGKEVMNSL